MGVGGKFWELLKPYAQTEGFDYLRDKRVAVDLSYWIVQNETAIKGFARKPHLRLTFFRTINLFSKFGAYPVFVVDGTPSALKSQARIERYLRFSGKNSLSTPVVEDGVSVERNWAFSKCVKECVELLQLFGMPVLQADGEAEALCAELNKNGFVDACITADSDAFLFGAICVIKCLRPNSKEPLECYHMSDIEAGLALKRKHLIAMSLLVGNDHDLKGVQGIGVDTALQFVRKYSEHEVLDRLCDIGNLNAPLLGSNTKPLEGSSPRTKSPHCTFCGHPGSKMTHLKSSCESCGTADGESCKRKPDGFSCNCCYCDEKRREKEEKKHESWWIKVSNKIMLEPNFPNDEIIKLYLNDNNRKLTDHGPSLSWRSPDTEMLVDFLVFHQLWEPSFIRQRLLPMLSTVYLREMAANPSKGLLHGQYEFHSIQRVKIRYGHQFYVVKWKKVAPSLSSPLSSTEVVDSSKQQEEIIEIDDEPVNFLEEPVELQIHVEDGSWYLLTDENMKLLLSAFPEEVAKFLQEKELKESKRGKALRCRGSAEKLESPKQDGVQLSITEFFRSSKAHIQGKAGDDSAKCSTSPGNGSSTEKRKGSSSNYSKAVRRRLLFGEDS